MSSFPRALLLAACLTSGLATTSCGATTATAPTTVVTVTATPTPPPTTQPPATQPATTTTSPAATPAPKRQLPRVVGMNLQAAQDTLQATGFFVLNDKDATGQNRLQVFDRNWLVVRQTPVAGKRVSTDTLITLYSKKIGE